MNKSLITKSDIKMVVCSRRKDCDPDIPCRMRQPFELIERLKDGWSCDHLPMPRQRCVAIDNYSENELN